jgi:hypothetical protein
MLVGGVGIGDDVPVITSEAKRVKVWALGIFALAGIAVFLVLPPLRQAEAYHQFADGRTMLGVPNFLNVISNAPFALFGVLGLGFACGRSASGKSFIEARERIPFAVFFAGAFLTCFGSGYYHWNPNDATLTWDRLPMTLAFMGLLAAMIAERIEVRAGLRLLWPLVIAGAASVWWWRRSGNLWPYACAQFFSILLVGLLLVLFPPRYTRTMDLLWVTGFYVLAKILEALDRPIYSITQQMVSGHTLKHLAASVSVYWVLRMLRRREAVTT